MKKFKTTLLFLSCFLSLSLTSCNLGFNEPPQFDVDNNEDSNNFEDNNDNDSNNEVEIEDITINNKEELENYKFYVGGESKDIDISIDSNTTKTVLELLNSNDLIIESSNSLVAKVEGLSIIPLSKGNTVITVKSKNISKNININVLSRKYVPYYTINEFKKEAFNELKEINPSLEGNLLTKEIYQIKAKVLEISNDKVILFNEETLNATNIDKHENLVIDKTYIFEGQGLLFNNQIHLTNAFYYDEVSYQDSVFEELNLYEATTNILKDYKQKTLDFALNKESIALTNSPIKVRLDATVLENNKLESLGFKFKYDYLKPEFQKFEVEDKIQVNGFINYYDTSSNEFDFIISSVISVTKPLKLKSLSLNLYSFYYVNDVINLDEVLVKDPVEAKDEIHFEISTKDGNYILENDKLTFLLEGSYLIKAKSKDKLIESETYSVNVINRTGELSVSLKNETSLDDHEFIAKDKETNFKLEFELANTNKTIEDLIKEETVKITISDESVLAYKDLTLIPLKKGEVSFEIKFNNEVLVSKTLNVIDLTVDITPLTIKEAQSKAIEELNSLNKEETNSYYYLKVLVVEYDDDYYLFYDGVNYICSAYSKISVNPNIGETILVKGRIKNNQARLDLIDLEVSSKYNLDEDLIAYPEALLDDSPIAKKDMEMRNAINNYKNNGPLTYELSIKPFFIQGFVKKINNDLLGDDNFKFILNQTPSKVSQINNLDYLDYKLFVINANEPGSSYYGMVHEARYRYVEINPTSLDLNLNESLTYRVYDKLTVKENMIVEPINTNVPLYFELQTPTETLYFKDSITFTKEGDYILRATNRRDKTSITYNIHVEGINTSSPLYIENYSTLTEVKEAEVSASKIYKVKAMVLSEDFNQNGGTNYSNIFLDDGTTKLNIKSYSRKVDNIYFKDNYYAFNDEKGSYFENCWPCRYNTYDIIELLILKRSVLVDNEFKTCYFATFVDKVSDSSSLTYDLVLPEGVTSDEATTNLKYGKSVNLNYDTTRYILYHNGEKVKNPTSIGGYITIAHFHNDLELKPFKFIYDEEGVVSLVDPTIKEFLFNKEYEFVGKDGYDIYLNGKYISTGASKFKVSLDYGENIFTVKKANVGEAIFEMGPKYLPSNLGESTPLIYEVGDLKIEHYGMHYNGSNSSTLRLYDGSYLEFTSKTNKDIQSITFTKINKPNYFEITGGTVSVVDNSIVVTCLPGTKKVTFKNISGKRKDLFKIVTKFA